MKHEKDEPATREGVQREGVEREGVEIDHAAEKKLVKKLDLNIIPIVMLLYLFSFLDRQVIHRFQPDETWLEKLMVRRVNIGNARLYGMEEDLGLVRNQYQTAVSLLFVTYLLSEVPSNLVLKKFTPSRWIAFITIVWSFMASELILKILIDSPVMGSHCDINRPYAELRWAYCLPSLTWRYGRRFIPRAHTLPDSFLYQTRNRP